MANATISNLGVADAAALTNWTADNALFEEQFAGEVLTAFEESVVFADKHLMRTISSGKSANFPATWKATARYHTAGTPIVGSNQIEHNQRTIKIDDLLIADVFIYDLEEAKNHYDVRSIYSNELGVALAKEMDTRIGRTLVLAARASATVASGNGGGSVTNASAKTDGEILAGAIFDANQILDEKDVPEGERYAAVAPAQYYLLAQTTKLLNKDWGGSGVYADGEIFKVAGTSLVKSNNMPSTNVIAATTGEQNSYIGDFTNTASVVWRKEAAGTVKLMDLAMEMSGPDFHIMYQGHMMVGKYSVGHGILRPECAVEIKTA